MRRTKLRTLAVALTGLPLLAACADGDVTPVTPEPGGELFARYVSMGNSITAGLQSAGINDSLQVRAYPQLLAARAGASFDASLISRPGCPRPFASPLGLAGRIGTADTCFRINVPRVVNNVAVPGERIGDLLHLPTDPSLLGLHSLLVGPRTQLQAMLAADPTLVSLWIGNNDALNGGLRGDLSLLTPEALFAARVDSVFAMIDQASSLQDGVVIGVVDPRVAPLLQPGAFYYFAYVGAVSQGQPSPFGRPVSADCAPSASGSQNQVSLAILGTDPAQVPVISCSDSAPLVLDAAEAQTVSQRVAAFNADLEAAATSRGFIFINPNSFFAPALSDPDQVRKCQGLATLTPTSTPAEIGAAIATTCPALTDPSVGFGNLISFDGVHPSSAAHVVVANAVAAALNAKYAGLDLPTS